VSAGFSGVGCSCCLGEFLGGKVLSVASNIFPCEFVSLLDVAGFCLPWLFC